MTKPFPIRESSMLSLSELIARGLGLLFLAHFVKLLGLEASAAFRIALPLIGVVAAFGSIGLPQALTRLFAAAQHQSGVARTDLLTALLATLCAVGGTLLLWFLLGAWFVSASLTRQELTALLHVTLPLLLLMCVTGSLRGMLLGLGHTFAPAIAQVLELLTRLLALTALVPFATTNRHISGTQVGILTLTLGDLAAGLWLGAVLYVLLQRRGIVRERSLRCAPLLRRASTVLRMSLASTGQSLLASLGYALELPLAQAWLADQIGAQTAAQWIAEYAAIALPLLCAPMVLTDSMATALLPLAATDRVHGGVRSVAIHLRRAIGAVAMVALPTTGALCVLASTLTAWFGAPRASTLLLLLAPLTLPLYLQAPLSALLQAQGRSRACFLAGLCGDGARLGGLWLGIVYGRLGKSGLALGLACAVLVQTAVLLLMARRHVPFRFPWPTLIRSAQTALTVAALLLLGQHVPFAFSLQTHPLLWGGLAAVVACFFLLMAKEITPQGLARLPFVGLPLGQLSEKVVRRLLD